MQLYEETVNNVFYLPFEKDLLMFLPPFWKRVYYMNHANIYIWTVYTQVELILSV